MSSHALTMMDQPKKHRSGKQRERDESRDYDKYESRGDGYKRREKYQTWKYQIVEEDDGEYDED